MTAEITEKSVRIIIDIPNTEGFCWDRACKLWAENFERSKQGFAGRGDARGNAHILGYCWYKVDPATNLPIEHLSGSAEDCCLPMSHGNIGELSEEVVKRLEIQLDYLKERVLRLKVNPRGVTDEDKECLMRDTAVLVDRVKQFGQAAKKQGV